MLRLFLGVFALAAWPVLKSPPSARVFVITDSLTSTQAIFPLGTSPPSEAHGRLQSRRQYRQKVESEYSPGLPAESNF